MVRCICGKELGESKVTVLKRPCRCGLPELKVKPGAPHVWWPMGNPERRAAGLPDKTDREKALDTRWV